MRRLLPVVSTVAAALALAGASTLRAPARTAFAADDPVGPPFTVLHEDPLPLFVGSGQLAASVTLVHPAYHASDWVDVVASFQNTTTGTLRIIQPSASNRAFRMVLHDAAGNSFVD